MINAGDGVHEHPTQALLDALTIRRTRAGFAGMMIAICGDITHSRVARSNVFLLNIMGARVAWPALHAAAAADRTDGRVVARIVRAGLERRGYGDDASLSARAHGGPLLAVEPGIFPLFRLEQRSAPMPSRTRW